MARCRVYKARTGIIGDMIAGEHRDVIVPLAIAAFDAARHATQPDPAALERMRALMPATPCNGYWHGRPGLERIEATTGVTA